MRNLKVIRTDPAHSDLADIWFEISLESPRAATQVIEALDRRILQLSNFPELGPARPDIAPDVRFLVEGSYLILYRVHEAEVEIVRVLHGARDIHDLF